MLSHTWDLIHIGCSVLCIITLELQLEWFRMICLNNLPLQYWERKQSKKLHPLTSLCFLAQCMWVYVFILGVYLLMHYFSKISSNCLPKTQLGKEVMGKTEKKKLKCNIIRHVKPQSFNGYSELEVHAFSVKDNFIMTVETSASTNFSD